MTPERRETATQSGSVTPERFARVRAIFEAAVSRHAAERRAYVEGACAGDPALLHEVEAMLAADQVSDRRHPSSAPEEGRFPAGTVLAGRYRILGLLGHGGMGEVYKAFDLILNQPVALKFLAPAHIGEAALVRFRNEVRIARQVSHPNVCRVYDLGMVEGLHFLSMEYIDGEDLASLLRRIGRLPQDKAIEFTRKICAGLSVAHERGVLHRDLKPANIMIDGRGHVRITDFGLAGLAAEIPLSDLRSGTPAYMSPEQKAGKEVTTRSDIYALGLVLHEMFTGKARQITQSSPSELVKDLDPAVERLILRCLQEDPKRRPNSALNVAMALPGADPIAAALAAGETPSPEMVAASTEKEGFSRRTAISCLILIVISLATGALLAPHTTLPGIAPLALPPDVLAFKAQDILHQLGYTEPPYRTAYDYDCCPSYYPGFLERYEPSRRGAILASHRPPVSFFWYRQHQSDFQPNEFPGYGTPAMVNLDSPANTQPGMIRMILDPKGRLVRLDVRPWDGQDNTASSSPPDGAGLFRAAGLDPGRFRSVAPQTIPPMAFDARLAWNGTYSPDRPEPVRVEAAFWKGRLVFLDVGELRQAAAEASQHLQPAAIAQIALFLTALVGSALAARRNLRLGRGDRAGAVKLAALGFFTVTIAWLIGAQHMASPWELVMMLMALSWAAFSGGALWMVYIAIEPHVRRNWPDSLISWTRLQSGRLRNSLVASHILAGITAAVLFQGLIEPSIVALIAAPPVDAGARLGHLIAGRFIWMRVTDGVTDIFVSMGFLLGVMLVRMLVRNQPLADALSCAIFSLLALGTFGTSSWRLAAGIVYIAAMAAVYLWLFRRLGLLSLFTAFTAMAVVRSSPILFSSWFAGRTLTIQLLILGVAMLCVWVIFVANEPRSTEPPA